ncbi:MAG: 3-dehydroquinate synthase [Bacteroidetes bacterium]|nr:3-dehydroquinate synthase [Bacteroidota bacterium]MBV6460365.1 3-dehydroquinate synthase [Flavobacteriales bacterium]WKZ74733.1 MAG: 3-dehydroquinate synthase [Vicingaceae bacterium]MCL4815767.1 3-dehydroquinate synthase [Flavobacteriales bacterium]NOG95787.1 3-dehydroquinate synthase [Bacteroidota bacterium]
MLHENTLPSPPIVIGNHSLGSLSEFIELSSFSKIILLCDEHTSEQCLPVLLHHVPALENVEILEIESGEENKTIHSCINLWEMLCKKETDRHSLLINLGGGVICDLGGFIASTYKRGISFINIPTTLLAQCDAAIGGKTGIDFANLKNSIGTFSQPLATYIFSGFIRTQSKKQLLSGYAEIIKHALIADKNLWEKIKKCTLSDLNEIEKILPASIQIKLQIIHSDPLEKNERKLLNFGHTIGHAIESLSLEWEQLSVLHGEAVAMGMICESFLSYKSGRLPHQELDEICNFIFSLYKPIEINDNHCSRLMEIMRNDKKNRNGYIYFTLLNTIGDGIVDVQVAEEMIAQALHFYSSKSALQKFP